MTQSTMIPETTIGIDLGDKKSHICVLSRDGEVQERAEVLYEPLRNANRKSKKPSAAAVPA